MNKETYEALKIVMEMAYRDGNIPPNMAINLLSKEEKAYRQVESWIDEVAKEYE